jgi:hypothetical protein
MAVLRMAQRKKLPKSEFALPGRGEGPSGKGAGSYPIPDPGHARNALARVSQHGTPEEKKIVRAKVRRKYPSIKQGGSSRSSSDRRGSSNKRSDTQMGGLANIRFEGRRA